MARPHRQFKIPSSPAKMIDLCVYVSPLDRDGKWAARLKRSSRYSPTQTVNHTDFEFISGLPLLPSIETKKPGVHWDKAQLQMGLWHAAQWSFRLPHSRLLNANDQVTIIGVKKAQETPTASSTAISASFSLPLGLLLTGVLTGRNPCPV